MNVLNAVDFKDHELLQILDRMPQQEIEINNLNGQRYIACGWKNTKKLVLRGTVDNNLGAFAQGPQIMVYGNAQEGVANTMSDGQITLHGRAGDIAGYGMRGGALLIRGDAGYRLGIHMKAYQEKKPVIVVGGSAGAFAGEYMAGGFIIVLGLESKRKLIGPYCGTGMYGGAIYLRGSFPEQNLASNLIRETLSINELSEIMPYLESFAMSFEYPLEKILETPFTRLRVLEERPFAHLYTGFVS
ncbi:MAG: glutamate synthase [Syntrophomonas sp.]